MTLHVGDMFINHSGWRLAHPDSDYERLRFPDPCAGELQVREIHGKQLTLICTACGFEIATSKAVSGPSADGRIESSAEAPF